MLQHMCSVQATVSYCSSWNTCRSCMGRKSAVALHGGRV